MVSDETRVCQNCKLSFVVDAADFVFYKKMEVPPPTFCPQCRLVRRLSWRNERGLHKRICAKCSKSMISIFAPDTPMTIYCSACWWSDSWEGLEYGVDFDPQRPFLLQLQDLLRRVPIMNVYSLYTTLVNSDYVNMCGWCKNCYLTTYSDRNEDCAYGSFVVDSKNSVDTLMIKNCEFVYEAVNCQNCYRTFYSVDCDSCTNVYFSRNCISCSDCFGCANLRNKKYHIFNEPYSKEEYEQKVKELWPTTLAARNELLVKSEQFAIKFPQRYMHGRQNTEVSGDYILNSKNTKDSYMVIDAEDCRYCALVEQPKDCYDCTNYFEKAELMYDAIQCGGPGLNVAFSWWVVGGNRDVQYSMFTIGSSNMFGTVGVKKKEYCILNKQYSKEEYERLRSQIIEHISSLPYVDKMGNVYKYGEFFPAELSPFGYNETTAQEFFPLSKEEAKAKNYNWKEPVEKYYQPTIQAADLPATIADTKDEILKETIACAHIRECNHQCLKVFKLIPAELQFYRQFNLPVPNQCHNCRHYRRLTQRNHITLTSRKCDCAGVDAKSGYKNNAQHAHGTTSCPNEFQTSYALDRSEIVYCEACYQQEVL